MWKCSLAGKGSLSLGMPRKEAVERIRTQAVVQAALYPPARAPPHGLFTALPTACSSRVAMSETPEARNCYYDWRKRDRDQTRVRIPLGPPTKDSWFSGVSRAIPRRRGRPRKTAEWPAMTPSNGNEVEMRLPEAAA